jgi:hypothetical protein
MFSASACTPSFSPSPAKSRLLVLLDVSEEMPYNATVGTDLARNPQISPHAQRFGSSGPWRRLRAEKTLIRSPKRKENG